MSRIVEEYRSAKILYNFLISNKIEGKFLLPSNVCAVLPLIFNLAQIDFDFLDIQKNDLCIDNNELLTLSNIYAGVLFVKSYGIETDNSSLFSALIEKNKSFIIIEDKCLCMPVFENILDNNVALSLYSLGYAKQVDLGVGAFGVIADKYEYFNIKTFYKENAYRNYELKLHQVIKNNTIIKDIKYNFLKPISFNFQRDKFEEIKLNVIKQKKQLNSIYNSELPQYIQMSDDLQNWRFNIFLNPILKNIILKKIFENNLFASSHYISMAKPWKGQTKPNSDYFAERIINLFNDLYYDEYKAVKTVELIKECCENDNN